MASIFDIAQLSETVTVRGNDIKVSELSGEALISLAVRFPELIRLFDKKNKNQITPATLGKLSGPVLGALIAAGTGNLGDEKAEKAARALGIGPVIDLVSVVLRLSIEAEGGLDPLAEKLLGLVNALNPGGEASNTASDTK